MNKSSESKIINIIFPITLLLVWLLIEFVLTKYPIEIAFNIITLFLISAATIKVKFFQLYFDFENLISTYHLFVTEIFIGNNFFLVVKPLLPQQFLNQNKEKLYIICMIAYFSILAFLVYQVNKFLTINYFNTQNLSANMTIMNQRDNNIKIEWETIGDVRYTNLAIFYQFLIMIIYFPFSLYQKSLKSLFLIDILLYEYANPNSLQ